MRRADGHQDRGAAVWPVGDELPRCFPLSVMMQDAAFLVRGRKEMKPVTINAVEIHYFRMLELPSFCREQAARGGPALHFIRTTT
ncbi:MAG: hypothetical protein ACLU3I_22390 [Acutalibacteraceae bacterium]